MRIQRFVIDPGLIDRGVDAINLHLSRGPAATLELALEVLRVRLLVPRGEWTRLIKTRKIRFSMRSGQMLLRIARHIAEKLNAQLVACLPMGWSILYPLAFLNLVALEKYIRTERITPETTKDEAEELRRIYEGKARDKGPKHPNVERRFLNLVEFSCETMNVLTSAERDWARRMAATLSEQLAADIPSSQAFLAKVLAHVSEK